MGIASVFGVLAIVLIMAIGMNFHPIYLSTKTWMLIVGLYIAIASVTPVWILLQPRDYSSDLPCDHPCYRGCADTVQAESGQGLSVR